MEMVQNFTKVGRQRLTFVQWKACDEAAGPLFLILEFCRYFCYNQFNIASFRLYSYFKKFLTIIQKGNSRMMSQNGDLL